MAFCREKNQKLLFKVDSTAEVSQESVSLSQGLSFFKGAESGERLFKMSRNKEYMYS